MISGPHIIFSSTSHQLSHRSFRKKREMQSRFAKPFPDFFAQSCNSYETKQTIVDSSSRWKECIWCLDKKVSGEYFRKAMIFKWAGTQERGETCLNWIFIEEDVYTGGCLNVWIGDFQSDSHLKMYFPRWSVWKKQ